MELVDLGLDQPLLDCLDDVALDLVLLHLEDLTDLLVTGLFDAPEHTGNCLDFDPPLELVHIHTCSLEGTPVLLTEGFVVTL